LLSKIRKTFGTTNVNFKFENHTNPRKNKP
jgi:hypothetical protein